MPTIFFGTVRQKDLDGNLWYPLLCIKFFDTPNFLKHWRDAHDFFRHCETKNFRRKNVIPPFSSIKLFETKIFLKNSRISLRNFSELWDIKISTENRDMPLLTFLSINVFRYKKFSGKQKGSLTKLFVSVLWERRFRQNRDSPLSYAWKLSLKDFFWNNEVFSNEIFRYSETKTSTENCDTPPPPYPSYFDTQNYFNSKGFPYGNSSMWDKKFSTENLDIPPSLIQTFSVPEVSETLNGSPTKFFGTVRQKIFDGKSWYPLPPLWCIKFFATRNFLIHRSVLQQNFLVLWDKKFGTKGRA